MSEKLTFTRQVNGNDSLKVGEQLRDLEGVDVGDYVTFTVEAVHSRGEQHE